MTARGAAGRCPPTGRRVTGERESRGEMTPSLSQTWLGPWMLLACLLASRSVAEVVSEHCSHIIGNGHLQSLQQLIDSQMETSCHIAFEFVDQEQLKDPVCYLKKAFFLVEDIMEDTLRFKHSTPNAKAILQLQELSLRLRGCFTKDHEEDNKTCVRTFYETPLQLLEKIKNVFNETKNLLKEDWNIFSKNCNNSFAKCSSQDVVTKPDCNCLYPKATPNSDLASPRQPLDPSTAPMAGLAWADAEGTQGNPLLPSEQAPGTVDPGSAKQRPPRSTCQSLESPETTGVEDSPPGRSLQPRPAVGAPTPGVEAILDPAMDTLWALEEASGNTGEGPVPGPEGNSVQAEGARPSNLLTASSALAAPAEAATGTAPPRVGSVRPQGLVWSHSPEKTHRPPALPPNHQKPGSLGALLRRLQGPSQFTVPATQPRLPRSHPWAGLALRRELEGRRSTRDRRSLRELDGAERASEGAAQALAPFNSLPLTDTGHERQHTGPSDPLLPGFAFRLLVPSIILVLLAVGGLLFYRRRRRSHQESPATDSPMAPPEGSLLTQNEDRQVDLPV
nr:macrophage colony-stimulating factor 1 isoform X2 [Oryctolagus cuniculus]